MTWAGRPITVYWDGRRRSHEGAAISTSLASAVGSRPFPESLSVVPPTPLQVRDDLPGQTIVLPYEWLRGSANEGPTWIVGRVSTRDAREAAANERLTIRDNLAKERVPHDNGTIFLLNSSLSRFDPFSFQTKFGALQLNGVTSSLLGWVSRLVFLLGGAFAISSLMMSVEERRPEIAALAALGYEPEFTQMALIEASFLFITSIIIGLTAAAALSVFVLHPRELVASLAAGLGLSAFFTIFVLVVATLLMGQSVAKRSVVSLMRGTT
ncbi:MAG TPA: ABC transporter permease [Allosphingosinicella sp.]|nr:ABC transporter permease [Allosphingosinicella sp.]